MIERLKGATLFLIVGKSGAGKSSVCHRLENRLGATPVESYTTRPPRYQNEKGHRFVTDYAEWRSENPKEQVVAETHFSGHDYWATAAQVEDAHTYVIDPAGIRRITRSYRGDKKLRVVYLQSCAISRYLRMRRRGDSRKAALRRIWYDWKAFRGVKLYADATFHNWNFEICCAELEEYFLKEDGVWGS